MHEQCACRRGEVDGVVVQNVHDVIQRPEDRAVVCLLHKSLVQFVCQRKKVCAFNLKGLSLPTWDLLLL